MAISNETNKHLSIINERAYLKNNFERKICFLRGKKENFYEYKEERAKRELISIQQKHLFNTSILLLKRSF